MIGAVLAAAMASAAPEAAPAPTFCGRMAKPYKMGRASGSKAGIFVGRLRADKGMLGYSGRDIVDNGGPCASNMGSVRCIVAGPGELTVSHAGFHTKFPLNEGERAVVVYDGKLIACQDLPPE